VKILAVCGARPNFIKIAALVRAFAADPRLETYLVHTGQHYSASMDRCFFEQLHIPRPDINLNVGSGSHAVQTARIMERFEPIVLAQEPDGVLVVGDVNSTLAAALVAAKLGVPVIHVEAGLRSFDRSMPEEVNRIVTDALSDLLFVTERSALANLEREGIDRSKIHFVGNVMIDTLQAHLAQAAESKILERLELQPQEFAVLTLHRPGNVDDREVIGGICGALEEIQKTLPIVFPLHPRTRTNLERMGLLEMFSSLPGLRLLDPLGYLDFLRLLAEAAIVLTDSGGIQEETTALGIPCLTLRENTERPVTIEQGTNRLVGTDPQRILNAYREVLSERPTGRVPELWDGHAAERIAKILVEWHRQRAA